MSESIYDEVLEILVDSLLDPQDEDIDCYILNHKQMIEISNAIRKAQEQEKLLELYKKVSSAIFRISSKYPLYIIREPDGKMVEQILNEIKEIEDEE